MSCFCTISTLNTLSLSTFRAGSELHKKTFPLPHSAVVVEDGSCRGDQVMAMIQCGGPNSDDGGRMMLGAMLMVIGDGSGDNVDRDYIKICW